MNSNELDLGRILLEAWDQPHFHSVLVPYLMDPEKSRRVLTDLTGMIRTGTIEQQCHVLHLLWRLCHQGMPGVGVFRSLIAEEEVAALFDKVMPVERMRNLLESSARSAERTEDKFLGEVRLLHCFMLILVTLHNGPAPKIVEKVGRLFEGTRIGQHIWDIRSLRGYGA